MSSRLRVFAAVVPAVVLAACMAGPNPAGMWTGTLDSPQGPFEMQFDFMVDGDELTGTMSNSFMGSMPIADGMVDGNELSFKVSIDAGPAGPMTLNYTGMLEGDQIAFDLGFDGTPPPGAPATMPFVAQRAAQQ